MGKKLLKLVIILACIILVLYMLFGVFKVHNIILKQFYPQKYSEYVEEAAKEHDLDPLLIYAIIKAESSFKPEAVSRSNAVGLMQLMDATAEETAKKIGIEYDKEMLKDPETNIKLGSAYFNSLYDKYNNVAVALTAYNAGTGNVDKWIGENTISDDGSDMENIPFRETNNYVRKILRDYEIYKNLYNN